VIHEIREEDSTPGPVSIREKSDSKEKEEESEAPKDLPQQERPTTSHNRVGDREEDDNIPAGEGHNGRPTTAYQHRNRGHRGRPDVNEGVIDEDQVEKVSEDDEAEPDGPVHLNEEPD